MRYRYEFKYQLKPEDARSFEHNMRRFGMKLDGSTDPAQGYYIVTSLYFDSPLNQHYEDKNGGLIERKKIRLRTYGPNLFTSKKLFLEIKHKFELKNRKTRFILTQEESRSLIAKGPHTLYDVPGNERDREIILRNFYEMNAKPAVYVRYKRKAYIDHTRDLRMTLDYNIEGAPFINRDMDKLSFGVGVNYVLLEIKFSYIMPPWLVFLLRSYNLDRISHSKFAICTDLVNQFNPLYK